MVKGFIEGDVVQLKSGGPQMTAVKEPAEELAAMMADQLQCQWFSKDDILQKGWFRPDTLVKVATK